MAAHCLSVLGPCKEVCQACQDCYDRYWAETEKKAVDDAIRVLRWRGYTVIPPEGTPS